jgi:hypothetical protein
VHPLVAVNEEGGTVQVAAERIFDKKRDWIGCTNLGPRADYEQRQPVPWGNFKCNYNSPKNGSGTNTPWPPPARHSERADVNYFPYLRDAFAMGSGMVAGQAWTADQTRQQLEDVGAALVRINTNVNLAPVLGISNGTYQATFLGGRVFADDPDTVVTYASAFSKGVHEGSDGRVATVVKHSPASGP